MERMTKPDSMRRPSRQIRRKRLSARSEAGIAWLREYMATPDDMGKEWWDEFNKELKENRLDLHREP